MISLSKEKALKYFGRFSVLIISLAILFGSLVITGLDVVAKDREIDDLRKGFVVLGYLINKIIWIQKSDGKTSTFMNKINFDGTDKMDLQELTNDLKEYLHIYRNHEKMIKSEPEELFVWEITSKYLNDEKLKTSPEEITFYIILGIHLGAYIKQ